ncbi:hypothetical protein Y032_0501g2592 [Ancylostoma ceylanicum]|uniref:Uncharacterized protein n=1 Tax=Ancylostoma ceylanicum TaxID=53326 RepID=A0A016WU88_9BILA|nr:hypothetical protein Y032_0501g2592 [Ancylostoma ceylanicum]
MTWKGEDRIDRLLKLEMPCALSKIDIINTMRGGYDAFRSAQRVLEEQQPIPITAAELKPLHDQYEDICTRLDSMGAMMTQSRMDDETAMAKMQQTLESIQRGMDDISSVSGSSHAIADQRLTSPVAEQRRTSPVAEQHRTSPEARHRLSRQEGKRTPRPRSRSRTNPSRHYARTNPRLHSTAVMEPSLGRTPRDDTRSPVKRRAMPTVEKEYVYELHRLINRIQEINTKVEIELRSSSEGASRRLENLRRDKSELKKTKDSYEERLKKIRRATHCSERIRSPHVRDQKSDSRLHQRERTTA